MKIVDLNIYREKKAIKQTIVAAQRALRDNLSFIHNYRYFFSRYDYEMMNERCWELMFQIRDLEYRYKMLENKEYGTAEKR